MVFDLRLGLGRSVGLSTGPCGFYGSIEHVVCRGFDQPPLHSPAPLR
jgi:hypothetical protein